MSHPGYEILSIDELDHYPSAAADAPILLPLRRRVGFQPFGVNCWAASAAGAHVIERHDERDGDEELYVVVRGHATFTVDGETIPAREGTLIHVPPDTMREAIADDAGTIVLALGAKSGEAWEPAPWEDFHVAFALRRTGDARAARVLVGAAIAAHPDAWQGRYNAACFEALEGETDAAFAQLERAFELGPPEVRDYVRDDGDFVALRSDPRWTELLG